MPLSHISIGIPGRRSTRVPTAKRPATRDHAALGTARVLEGPGESVYQVLVTHSDFMGTV